MQPGKKIEAMVAMFRSGRFEEALGLIDGHLREAPPSAFSWRFRGDCLLELARYREAANSYRMAAGLGGPGSDEAPIFQALAEFNDGRYDDAARTLRAVLRHASRDQPELALSAQRALKDVEQRLGHRHRS